MSATPSAKQSFFYMARLVICLALGVFVLFFALQRSMIYYPSRTDLESLRTTAAHFGFEPWLDAEGKTIGWKSTQENATGSAVIFHGNAGYALHRTGLVDILRETTAGSRLNYYIFEYPGYGAREGKPSESAILDAAVSGLEELRGNLGNDRLILVGESLGTGVASIAATRLEKPPHGLLLITPFDSLAAVAKHHYPWLPVDLILRDRFDSAKALREFNGPVAILLAERDEVVPSARGKKLYENYQGPKLLIQVDGSDHNGVVGLLSPEQWSRAFEFVLQ